MSTQRHTHTHTHTQHTQKLPGAGCSGHGHSPLCHACPHQFVLVGSNTKRVLMGRGFHEQGISWAAVPCAHPGDPELGTLALSVVQRWLLFHSSSPVWEREQPPLPVCSCISLGRQGTCRGSKLCSFPRVLSGLAVGARGATPRALSGASAPWGNPSVWLRAVPVPTEQQKEVANIIFRSS